MKKYLFLLITLLMMGVSTVKAQNVYVTENGSVYHKSKTCPTLKNSKKVVAIPLADAKKKGFDRPCKVCYGNMIAKKNKGLEQKTTNNKKVLPARDEKGRFIKADKK